MINVEIAWIPCVIVVYLECCWLGRGVGRGPGFGPILVFGPGFRPTTGFGCGLAATSSFPLTPTLNISVSCKKETLRERLRWEPTCIQMSLTVLQGETYLSGSGLSSSCCFVFLSGPLETLSRRLMTTTSKTPFSIVKKEFFILKALSKLA